MSFEDRNAIILAAALPFIFMAILYWARRADRINFKRREDAAADALGRDVWTLVPGGQRQHELPFHRDYFAEYHGFDRLHPLFHRVTPIGPTWIFGHPVMGRFHHSLGHTAEIVCELPQYSKFDLRIEQRSPVQIGNKSADERLLFIGVTRSGRHTWSMYSSEDTPRAAHAAERLIQIGIPRFVAVIQLRGRYLSLVGGGAYWAPSLKYHATDSIPFAESLYDQMKDLFADRSNTNQTL